jgi:alpha-1,3-glucosyltransferase
MWPLLKKDELGLQYLLVTFLWNYSLGYNPLKLPSTPVKSISMVRLVRDIHCRKC